MTLRKFDPAMRLTVDVTCAACGRIVPVGEPVRRTRGLMRHNGSWLGECCWGHA